MSDRKFYSYDDLDLFSRKYTELINNKLKELNKDKNIILPTELDYKKLAEEALKKMIGIGQCWGTYVSGKNRGDRCLASPHPNSNYCLKHKTQDPRYKQILEETAERYQGQK
jgi:hypothetical protein